MMFLATPFFLSLLIGVGLGVAPPQTEQLIRSLPTNKFYINGTWVDPILPDEDEAFVYIEESDDNSLFFKVIDPSTAKIVARVATADPKNVDRAVRAARNAWFDWAYETSLEERISLVERLADIYEDHIEELALLISTEMGSPIDAARNSHAWGGLGNIREFLEVIQDFEFERSMPYVEEPHLTTLLYEPIGVVGMITPWNWPLHQITLKVIPALLVGCTCVLKPSEESPLSAILFAQLMHQAGFPPGVFNLISEDGVRTGNALTKHSGLDLVSFTGSTRAGKLVASNAALAGPTKTALELGGKGANILFADIGDEWMKEAVIDGVESVFYNSGQTCTAPTRMLVQEPYYDRAIEWAREVANNYAVNSAHLAGDEHIGPVVSEKQFTRVQEYIRVGIEEDGATLVAGGLGRPEHLKDNNGYYVRPTVFADCTPKMTIMQEEIFGPVLCITKFTTEDEALEIANDTVYGLKNYVSTTDPKKGRKMGRLLRSGMVDINDGYGNQGSPFGGVKGSGYGKEGGMYGLEEFCVIKAVTGFPHQNVEEEQEFDESEAEL